MQNILTKLAPSCPLWVFRLFPFLRWWPSVNASTSRDDAMAGLTGALIVLPQGVAFATIAGLPPEYGLYAAMAPAIIAALFGSSWHLVSGPTTAISIAVFASVSPFATPGSPEFISMVLTLTFLTGVFQLILGLARMGVLVNFISHTVVIGFTAGAAMLIAGSQIKNFFGLDIPRGTPFFETLALFARQIDAINPYVTAVAVITLASGILVKLYLPRFPYMIAAMLVGSFAALGLNAQYGVDVTHIKTVGALPSGLPPLSAPDFSFATLNQMLFPSLIITMLALTEAVSISRAIATKSGQHIDGNQEFVGQGLSNVVGSFFSSYASSGSFNRSGVNYAAGARTPLAAVFASLFLVVILLMVAPLAAYLPNAAMAGILFLVAWGLIDFHHISLLPNVEPECYHYVPLDGRQECPQVKLMRFNGSIFFGAVSYLQQQLQGLEEREPQRKHLVVMGSGINFVDLAGAEFLAEAARQRRKIGGGLYFYRMKDSLVQTLKRGSFMDDVGADNLFPAKSRPIEAIYPQLDNETCRNCSVRAFGVCQQRLPNGEVRPS